MATIIRDAFVKGGVNGGNTFALPTLTTTARNEIIYVFTDESQDTSTVSSITGAGLVFTKIGSVNKGVGNGNVEAWSSLASSIFSGIITVNFANVNNPQANGIAVSYKFANTSGLNNAGARGALNTIGSTTGTPSAALNTYKQSSLVIAAFGASSNNAFTPGASQTVVTTATTASATVSELILVEQNTITTTANTSVTMSGSMTSNPVGVIAIEIMTGNNMQFNNYQQVTVGDGMSTGEKIR